jgi:hypothetical protein
MNNGKTYKITNKNRSSRESKIIEEFVGRGNSASTSVSIARME